MQKATLKQKTIHSDPRAKQANILSHLTAKFPPSYFTDSNFASFQNQAKSLNKRLNLLGVRNELNLYSLEQKRILHGYANADSEFAKDNMEKTILYISSL